MSDQIRTMILTALSAARYGDPVDPAIVRDLMEAKRQLKIEDLKFDSLAWMEFCISIELQTGEELVPAEIEKMQYFGEIEDWLRCRRR